MDSQRFAVSERRPSVISTTATIGHENLPPAPPPTPTSTLSPSDSPKSPILRAVRRVGKILPLAIPQKLKMHSRSSTASPLSPSSSTDSSSDNLMDDTSDSGASSIASVDSLCMLEGLVAEKLAPTPRGFAFPSCDLSEPPLVFADNLEVPRRSRFSSFASFNPFSRPTSPDFLETSSPFSRPGSPMDMLSGLTVPLASLLPERDPTEGLDGLAVSVSAQVEVFNDAEQI